MSVHFDEVRKLFDSLRSRSIALTVQDEQLFAAPRAALTGADIEAITANKGDLMQLVVEHPYVAPSIVNGDLRIPFDAHPRFHYWGSGQSIARTLAELQAPPALWWRAVAHCDDLLDGRHSQRCKGVVEQAGDVVFCEGCRYFLEVES